MNRTWRGGIVALVSAVAGGLIVFTAAKAKPEIIGKAKTEESATNGKELEKKTFEDILRDQDKIFRNFDSLFDRDFFRHEDPFTDMKNMRERLQQRFDDWSKDLPGGILASPFDSWYTERFGGALDDISRREDKDNVYYEIKVKDLDESKVNTKVENGFVTITGEMKKVSPEKGDSKEKSLYQSTFRRVFPVPENTDSDHMELISENGKVVLRFPKRK